MTKEIKSIFNLENNTLLIFPEVYPYIKYNLTINSKILEELEYEITIKNTKISSQPFQYISLIENPSDVSQTHDLTFKKEGNDIKASKVFKNTHCNTENTTFLIISEEYVKFCSIKVKVTGRNLYYLTKELKKNIALILEKHDYYFVIETENNIREIISINITYKLNSEFLLSTMEKYKDTSLYILADSPKDLKNKNTISINSLTKFFDILRDTFSYVIVDTSGGFDPFALKAIELSDLAFLLLVVNLPSLRNCQRYLEMFDETNDKKIKIIVNRYMENDEINSDEVEKILGKKLYWKIPNNYFTMMSANNKGVPVSTINPDSNVALNIKNLALNISEKNYRG